MHVLFALQQHLSSFIASCDRRGQCSSLSCGPVWPPQRTALMTDGGLQVESSESLPGFLSWRRGECPPDFCHDLPSVPGPCALQSPCSYLLARAMFSAPLVGFETHTGQPRSRAPKPRPIKGKQGRERSAFLSNATGKTLSEQHAFQRVVLPVLRHICWHAIVLTPEACSFVGCLR